MVVSWRTLVITGVVVGIILGIVVWPSLHHDIEGLFAPTDTDAGWASKVGWRLCNDAIAAWPNNPAPACWKLAICDNEGALTPSERARLDHLLRDGHCDR
jgi:hypothetical protein